MPHLVHAARQREWRARQLQVAAALHDSTPSDVAISLHGHLSGLAARQGDLPVLRELDTWQPDAGQGGHYRREGGVEDAPIGGEAEDVYV
eukprot:259097-Pyramimonas_sp.AAC.2